MLYVLFARLLQTRNQNLVQVHDTTFLLPSLLKSSGERALQGTEAQKHGACEKHLYSKQKRNWDVSETKPYSESE